MRLSEWRRRFAQTPSLMLDVVESTSLLTSAHGGAKLAIVQQLGLQSHPTVVDLQARGSLTHKMLTQVVYHCDLATIQSSQGVAQKAVDRFNASEARKLKTHATANVGKQRGLRRLPQELFG
eukprot:4904450-Alexandrium_andersonii.AAC.1